MKKLLLLFALFATLNVVAQVREPFAPAGSSWKYWYADEFTTGYINVIVLTDTVSITGVINGTTDTITVNCSEIYTPRGFWVGPEARPQEEPLPEEYKKGNARYMFKEGNKAYIYDKYDQTFYKLIDMDAQPGDQWEMSLFNGTIANDFSHYEFTQDTTQGVPVELLPYYRYNTSVCITDLNWACNLGNAKFQQFLINNGITQEQIDVWEAEASCVTTGTVDAGMEHELYSKATNLLTSKGYAWTDSTWACDFKYYNDYVAKWGYTEVSYTEKNTIFALCDAPLATLTESFPMPEEIVKLWAKSDHYEANDGISPNYNFKLITRYNWPAHVTGFTMENEMQKPVEEGGLGLTAEQIDTAYTQYSNIVYVDRLVPGEVDLIEVTEKKTIDVNGEQIPVVVMGPACESLLNSKALRSEVSLNGAFNIDFFNLVSEPWPIWLESGSSYEIYYFGLLCAQNGEKSLETPALTKYFENGLKDKFDAGNISCGEIEAPKFGVSDTTTNKSASIFVGDNPFGAISSTGNYSLKNGAVVSEPDSVFIVNTVVHVIHNESNPEGKISETQIKEMLDAINSALLGTNDQSGVNDDFTSVIGIPGIKLKLATLTPDNVATNGIVYHTTTEDYFSVGTGTAPEEKYAFKFDDVGRPYNWDHKRYLNIYIADFNGKNNGQVGGFVTNPEPTGTNDPLYNAWLESNDSTFWKSWLDSEDSDASVLDGLSLDYYNTFMATELTPDIKYKTAIHELGHYFGLKHTFALVVEKTVYMPFPVKVETLYGDNFDDTPEQYYKTMVYDNCQRELYQCGNLIQINNFMDYSLPCACMFTEQQAAYMQNFTEALRPGIFVKKDYGTVTGIEDIPALNFDVCPNPTSGIVNVSIMDNKPFSVYVATSQGQIIDVIENAYHQTEINLEGLPSGIYFLRIVSEGKITSSKVVKQ
ncbi:T9SS type A sorting domain-containing protein [Maribellus sp. CM-23]|uniref:zinc-dependent metalloprotease n=1 Tax=Maribellus sp. CM-23 TaxID=2781026 RepID=UPI001F307BC1|nr:zinc-dependent metalloprotease [Maribellus sp. CM-23]MCE4566074.1 T9SS type A sorting domain-containing protein [Maribellus sp. CM-23]